MKIVSSIISSLLYWPKQIFWPGDEADTKTSVAVVVIGFILSYLAIAAGTTITIIGFAVAWLATAWARHEMDRGDAYALRRARVANAAYIIGAIGWIFRMTTILLLVGSFVFKN